MNTSLTGRGVVALDSGDLVDFINFRYTNCSNATVSDLKRTTGPSPASHDRVVFSFLTPPGSVVLDPINHGLAALAQNTTANRVDVPKLVATGPLNSFLNKLYQSLNISLMLGSTFTLELTPETQHVTGALIGLVHSEL